METKERLEKLELAKENLTDAIDNIHLAVADLAFPVTIESEYINGTFVALLKQIRECMTGDIYSTKQLKELISEK